jgi:hypothetical protein
VLEDEEGEAMTRGDYIRRTGRRSRVVIPPSFPDDNGDEEVLVLVRKRIRTSSLQTSVLVSSSQLDVNTSPTLDLPKSAIVHLSPAPLPAASASANEAKLYQDSAKQKSPNQQAPLNQTVFRVESSNQFAPKEEETESDFILAPLPDDLGIALPALCPSSIDTPKVEDFDTEGISDDSRRSDLVDQEKKITERASTLIPSADNMRPRDRKRKIRRVPEESEEDPGTKEASVFVTARKPKSTNTGQTSKVGQRTLQLRKKLRSEQQEESSTSREFPLSQHQCPICQRFFPASEIDQHVEDELRNVSNASEHADGKRACPLCCALVPEGELQAHVDEELQRSGSEESQETKARGRQSEEYQKERGTAALRSGAKLAPGMRKIMRNNQDSISAQSEARVESQQAVIDLIDEREDDEDLPQAKKEQPKPRNKRKGKEREQAREEEAEEAEQIHVEDEQWNKQEQRPLVWSGSEGTRNADRGRDGEDGDEDDYSDVRFNFTSLFDKPADIVSTFEPRPKRGRTRVDLPPSSLSPSSSGAAQSGKKWRGGHAGWHWRCGGRGRFRPSTASTPKRAPASQRKTEVKATKQKVGSATGRVGAALAKIKAEGATSKRKKKKKQVAFV